MRLAYWEIRAPGRDQCRRDERGRLLPRDDAIMLGRKFCAGCGHWRQVCDFGYLRNRGLRARCRVCHNRESNRRYHALTPEQMERLREYWRIIQEVHRRQAGVPVRVCRRRSVIDRREAIYLPTEPLLHEMKHWPGSLEELARLAGVPSRTIYRFRYDESKRVQIDVADKIATALGVPSAVIWGDSW